MNYLQIIIRKSPLFRLLIPFILGVLFANYYYKPTGYLIISAVTVSILFLFYFLRKKIFIIQRASNYVLLISFFVFGFLFFSVTKNERHIKFPVSNEKYIAQICDTPQPKDFYTQFTARIISRDSLNSSTVLVRYYDTVPIQFQYGDILSFQGKVSEIQNRGNHAEFDYKGFMAQQGIFHKTSIYAKSNIRIVGSESSLKRKAAQINTRLSEALMSENLSKENSSILKAITLGIKYDLEYETRQTFVDAGVIHILAVSGLHVGIIYVLLIALLYVIPSKPLWLKYLKLVVSLACIWGYAILTGLGISVIRASIMFSVFLVGNILGSKAHPVNSLSAAAFIVLLINPLEILNIGFQFSFLAVFGILTVYPVLHNLLSFKSYLVQKLWEFTLVTFSAQLLIVPLQIHYFNSFTPVSFLTNIFAIPFASIMLYGGLSLMLFSFTSSVHSILALVLDKLMNVFLAVLHFFNGLFETPSIFLNLISVLFLFLSLIILVIFFLSGKAKALFLSLSFVCVFLISCIWFEIDSHKQQKLLVYNIPKSTCFSYVNGNSQYVFADTTILTNSIKENFYLKRSYLENRTTQDVVLFNIHSLINYRSDILAVRILNDQAFILMGEHAVYYTPRFKETARIPANFIFTDYLSNKEVDFDNYHLAFLLNNWKEEGQNQTNIKNIRKQGGMVLNLCK
jgi:competence protein ComEC